jgi:exportin-T
MEIMVRYSTELQLQPDFVPTVLEFFVGSYGIHSSEAQVQLRAWYLFERLLAKMQNNLASMSEQILAAFTDLLQINITPASKLSFQTADSDSDTESEHDLVFDNQLYLFQSAGLLIAYMHTTNFKAGEALLQSLIENINGFLQLTSADQTLTLNIHHIIMAIGDIAKGFDGANDTSVLPRQQIGNRLFNPASEIILKALTKCEDSSFIRDAVSSPMPLFYIHFYNAHYLFQTRYAFTRLVNVMGENILEKIPALLGGLLRKSTTWELIDFLPFLGQLIHKFKVLVYLISLRYLAENTRFPGRINVTLVEQNI